METMENMNLDGDKGESEENVIIVYGVECAKSNSSVSLIILMQNFFRN